MSYRYFDPLLRLFYRYRFCYFIEEDYSLALNPITSPPVDPLPVFLHPKQ